MTYLEVDDRRFNTSEITKVVLRSFSWDRVGDEGWCVDVHLCPKWYTFGKNRCVRLFYYRRLRKVQAEKLYDWVYQNWKGPLMTTELTRVENAIKADPQGEVARNVAHWLAVNVMGWECINEICYTKKYEKWAVAYWNPFANANHTIMLWKAVCEKHGWMSASELAYDLGVNLLTQEPIDVVLSILNDEGCRGYLNLTDETLKGF